MLTIRPFTERDWDATWEVLNPVFRAGDTFPFWPSITKDAAHAAWIKIPSVTYIAEDENANIVGTYYIKPNQPTLGAHVCNCGYVVAEAARGQGVASKLCEHSQQESITLGFRGMQYNLVVSINGGAIRLWQKHGFDIIGTLPNAFKHSECGYVDALVMYKQLET